jgi:tetratricopeptide (TPR) repeat protein
MSLTKRQKRFLLDNCLYLTLNELSGKTGIKEHEIDEYLKKNKKKALASKLSETKSNLKTLKTNEIIETIDPKDIGFLNIVKKNWKFLVLILLGTIAIYFNSLHGDFVSDDYASITQNPTVTDFKAQASGMTLSGISTFLLASIFGTKSPVSYHIYSLLLYLLVLVVAFVLLSLFFKKEVVYWTILIFAVLPVHVESVSWISGKPYLLSALFVLSSLMFLFLYLKSKQRKYLWLFIAFIPLTFMADKVRSFSLIFLLILFFVSFSNQFRQFNFKKILPYLGIAFVLIMLFLSPKIMGRISDVNSGYNSSESIYYDPFFQYPTAIPKYLQLIFVPTDLTLYHTMYIIPSQLNWIILIVYLAALAYFFFIDKRIFFALAFIFAAAAPSMAPVKVSWLVAERYIFLGSLGFCLFLGLIFEKLGKKYYWLSWVFLISLVTLYSMRVVLRNIDWRTNHNLWVNTCQVSPNSHNAWNNIGDDYDKLKQFDNAVKGFTQSTVVKPNYADAFHNRANIFYKMGRYDLARNSYETALSFSPGLYQTYFSLIQIDLMESKYNLAIQHAQKVLELQPNNPQALYVLSVVYLQAGMKQEASKVIDYTLQIFPNYKPVMDLKEQIKKL